MGFIASETKKCQQLYYCSCFVVSWNSRVRGLCHNIHLYSESPRNPFTYLPVNCLRAKCRAFPIRERQFQWRFAASMKKRPTTCWSSVAAIRIREDGRSQEEKWKLERLPCKVANESCWKKLGLPNSTNCGGTRTQLQRMIPLWSRKTAQLTTTF
jgi:hypothetical protein